LVIIFFELALSKHIIFRNLILGRSEVPNLLEVIRVGLHDTFKVGVVGEVFDKFIIRVFRLHWIGVGSLGLVRNYLSTTNVLLGSELCFEFFLTIYLA
jgi:hypothetical protein